MLYRSEAFSVRSRMLDRSFCEASAHGEVNPAARENIESSFLGSILMHQGVQGRLFT
jgi:hypothetical protein